MKLHTASPEHNKIDHQILRDSRIAVDDCAVFADSLSAGLKESVFLRMYTETLIKRLT